MKSRHKTASNSLGKKRTQHIGNSSINQNDVCGAAAKKVKVKKKKSEGKKPLEKTSEMLSSQSSLMVQQPLMSV